MAAYAEKWPAQRCRECSGVAGVSGRGGKPRRRNVISDASCAKSTGSDTTRNKVILHGIRIDLGREVLPDVGPLPGQL